MIERTDYNDDEVSKAYLCDGKACANPTTGCGLRMGELTQTPKEFLCFRTLDPTHSTTLQAGLVPKFVELTHDKLYEVAPMKEI